ncbi:MAG: hypothetical protein Q7T29_00355 [Gallionella sp.]|nr:hypothetical protein [Gallionella sp.]
MNTLSKRGEVEFQCRPMPVIAGVTPKLKLCVKQHAMKQRGVVLFFALIALVIMSLAAVALIRSVDTSTMIAGNLAFKQAATSSGDAGIETAIEWLTAAQLAMKNANKNVYKDATHTFNNTNAAMGYYSNADPALSLIADPVWDAIDPTITYTDSGGNIKTIEATDSSSNTIRFVIQRMCRIAYPANDARNIPDINNCLFSSAALDNSGKQIPLPQNVCQGSGCPSAGQTPQIRITVRITGPKNTVSYIQSFVN